MTKVDKKQVIRFNTLLNRLKLTELKRDLIAEATGGRTEHTLDMNRTELKQLIDHLASFQQNDFKKGHAKRRRILSICHQLPPELGFTRFDDTKGSRVVDMQRLNAFLCGPKSIFHKPLNDHTPAELSRVIVQFENMLKSYLKPHSN